MSGCSSFRPSGGTRDECLVCGRTAEEHGLPAQVLVLHTPKRIKIWFQGKYWEYSTWKEARKDGFYLG